MFNGRGLKCQKNLVLTARTSSIHTRDTMGGVDPQKRNVVLHLQKRVHLRGFCISPPARVTSSFELGHVSIALS